jgi:hypothetical protein
MASGGGRDRQPVVGPAMRVTRGVKQDDGTLDGNGHRLAVPLSQLRRSLDVGEEEGDGAGGQIGHDPSQCIRSVELLADCRTRV